jgi:N-acetyl-anhydromuramyl-L-alanine amidase AmpD
MRAVTVDGAERRHSHVLQQPLAAPRIGVMLHYDDSSRDDWAVDWFSDPRCTNGYTWLVLDDGRVIELASPTLRTPHAGICRTPNANSAFYGLAAATNGRVPVTRKQFDAMVRVCARVFTAHGWTAESAAARIVGHDTEAVWSAASTPKQELWGTLGRKVDPTGTRADGVPVLAVTSVRSAVKAALARDERDERFERDERGDA